MNKIAAICTVLALSPLLLLTSTASGQTPSAVNSLTFDNIYPGVPKAVDKRTAGKAAEFNVTGDPGSEVYVDFTLPAVMTKGTDVMPLSFSNTDCSIDSSDPGDQSNPPWDNLNPKIQNTVTLGSGGLSIWLGGKVIPSIAQPQGAYSADIIITITPTGS